MLPPMKIFGVSQEGPLVIVTPAGGGDSFAYQDLHLEANALRQHMGRPGNDHLIVDLTHMDYFGSEFIGAIVSMLRETRNRQGQAMLCSASPQMFEVLQNMNLYKLFPYRETLAAARVAVESTLPAPAAS